MIIIVCHNNARIVHNNCRKNMFPIFFLGGGGTFPPPSPTPMLILQVFASFGSNWPGVNQRTPVFVVVRQLRPYCGEKNVNQCSASLSTDDGTKGRRRRRQRPCLRRVTISPSTRRKVCESTLQPWRHLPALKLTIISHTEHT